MNMKAKPKQHHDNHNLSLDDSFFLKNPIISKLIPMKNIIIHIPRFIPIFAEEQFLFIFIFIL